MNDIEPESPFMAQRNHRVGVGRRRLLRGGLVAAPVVLALSGRSAMAAACPSPLTPALIASLDPDGNFDCAVSSHHVVISTFGRSPSFWRPNPLGQTFQPPYPWSIAPFSKLTIGRKSSSWNKSLYLSYKDIASSDPCWATGTKFRDVFTNASDQRSFSRILLDDNGSLNWHWCAAYLNARALSGTYAMTVQEVLSIASTWRLVPGAQVLSEGQLKAFLSQTWA